MKKIICMTLTVIMLLASLALFAGAEEATAPVYYPNGTIILQESDFKNADLSQYFKAMIDKPADGKITQITFNTETDRLRIASPEKTNSVTDLIAVPKNLDNYTLVADLYMTENVWGNNAIMGIGVNSASAWSRSTYFQVNVYDVDPVKYWFNNYNSEGKQAGGNVGATGEAKYELGTKISIRIEVTPETVTAYYNDMFLTIFKAEKLGYALGTGSPFFIQRGSTVMEIDNLTIFAGTGEPDYAKTMANQQPLSAPEVETQAPETQAPETQAPETQAPETQAPETQPAETTPDSVADTTPDATEEPKSGCGAAIGMSVLGVIALAGATVLANKRRR